MRLQIEKLELAEQSRKKEKDEEEANTPNMMMSTFQALSFHNDT